jgi:nitrogen fixation-related uncharacterized protein
MNRDEQPAYPPLMRGALLIAELEREGFIVARRSSQFVWLERSGERILVDERGEVADHEAHAILRDARSVT